ncbi:MAG: VOC family protein [Candidatus Dormibacter sp.]
MAFGHVGLQVADLERSSIYYQDVIGLIEFQRQVRNDHYLQLVTGYPGVELSIALLVEPQSGVIVELLEYRGVEGTPINPATANSGTGHVCFEVDDVDAIYERAVAAGHRAVHEPVTPTGGRWKGGRSIYMLDPDGIRVELVQSGGSTDATAAPLGPADAIATESVFLVEATYSQDAAERRVPHRSQHLTRLAALRRQGVLIEGGAFLDVLSASLMLIRATTSEGARRIAEEDVYSVEGVWETVRVRPFGRVAT